MKLTSFTVSASSSIVNSPKVDKKLSMSEIAIKVITVTQLYQKLLELGIAMGIYLGFQC